MKDGPAYTEREQSAAQRRQLIDMGRAWVVAQGTAPGSEAEALYARYGAGELTLQDVTDELVSIYRQRSQASPGPPAWGRTQRPLGGVSYVSSARVAR